MGKKLFLVDAEKCTGCALCVVACKDEHVGHSYLPWTGPQPDTGHFWVDVRGLERGNIPRVAVSHLPVFCQHCENAACLKACPDNAIFRREDGLVWIDESACSGCGLCVEACPYDAIFMNETRAVAQKCTGCAHRVDEGLEPRCAEICPHEAIVFGEASDIFSDRDASQADWGVLHPEFDPRSRVLWRGLPTPFVAGCVFAADGDEVLTGAEIELADLFDDTVQSGRSDAFGEFKIADLKNGHKYRVEIRLGGYRTWVKIITAEKGLDLGEIAMQTD